MNKVIMLFTALFFALKCSLAMAYEFPLPASNFVKAKMPMYAVYPRPDADVQAHARHRWAHPDMPYQIPVGIQGGAWPFKYEIVEGPAGAEIGQHYGDDNYGAISWEPTESTGTVEFTVRVTDQELNTINLSWTVNIDASMFVFVQDGWSGPKNGTINEPLEDVVDWYKGDLDDKTYHNKIIVFRGGDYELIGDLNNANGNVRLNADSKTPSIIGFPGETPIFDCSRAKILTDNGDFKDLFVAGITWKNGRADVANSHFWWAVGDVSRSTWWRNHFDNIGKGTVGNDNAAPVLISSSGANQHKEHILYSENLHTNINNRGSNGAYLDIFTSSYVLVERNIARDSSTYAGFWMKTAVSYVTVRANEAWDNVRGTQIEIGYAASSGILPHDQEVCWNRIVANSSQGQDAVLLFAMNDDYEGRHYNSFIYRNTFVNGSSWVRFEGREPYVVEGNVVVTVMRSRWKTSIMTGTIPNIVGSPDDNITDEAGRLVGNYRTVNLGKVGYEVTELGVSPIKTPLPPSVN